jgi:pentatricopeptide repeat protein
MGLQPDVYSYTSALSACNRAGQIALANKLFHAMCTKGPAPSTVSAYAIDLNMSTFIVICKVVMWLSSLWQL